MLPVRTRSFNSTSCCYASTRRPSFHAKVPHSAPARCRSRSFESAPPSSSAKASTRTPSFSRSKRKFSIPVACLVFGLIGLALGVSNRRDGKLASFVIGISVIFVYYVLLWLGQGLARGQIVSPWLAAWMPNLALGGLGALLFVWRDRVADRPIRLGRLPAVPTFRIPSLTLPMLGILDRYVVSTYSRIAGLSAISMAGIFYISTFLDLSEWVFRGQATWGALGSYFWYVTPQYVYFILPLAVLLAALVTIGLLTKNSELVVMKACGISLYRVALPLVGAALIVGGALFLLEETVLGPSNRRAQAIRHVIGGGIGADLRRPTPAMGRRQRR